MTSDIERDLEGLTALVTGGSRRIGLAIGRELAAAGAAIVVNFAHDETQAAKAVEAIRANGGRAAAMRADVSDPAQVSAMVAEAADRFGGIDILVNNAAARPHSRLKDIRREDWDRVLGLTLDGAFFCAQACEPYLGRSGRGSILNIGGLAAQTGHAEIVHVSAAKMGLVGLTRSLAHHYGPLGVTVNCLVPGAIVSDEDGAERRGRQQSAEGIPLRRLGSPSDVAGVVRSLVGARFRFVTGQTIHLNGGLHMA